MEARRWRRGDGGDAPDTEAMEAAPQYSDALLALSDDLLRASPAAPPSRRRRVAPTGGCPSEAAARYALPDRVCRVSRAEPDAPGRALPSCAAPFMAHKEHGAAGSPSADRTEPSGSAALLTRDVFRF